MYRVLIRCFVTSVRMIVYDFVYGFVYHYTSVHSVHD
jgi:hypothetical protein